MLSDSEVITIALIIETFFQGHEEVGYAFVSQYLTDIFRNLIDLDRFDQCRRELVWFIEAIRRDLRDQIIDQCDRLRVVDSGPITTMTYTRGSRCKSMVGSDYFGVVTSKKGKFFGLRLHATVTADQLIDEWLLAPAAITDAKVLDELVLRVETVFSTLTTVFNVQRPWGRSLAGHVTRIAICVLAHTLSFLMV